MTEDEVRLWERFEPIRQELIAFYLPIVDGPAKYFARSIGWDNWEDLRQAAAFGLMKAIERFKPDRGVDFRVFAKRYIRGAILDSPELSRNMTRTQREIYRKARKAEDSLTKAFHRNPTIEEIAEETKLTTDQIRNAFAALGLTNPKELEDEDDRWLSALSTATTDSHILIEEAFACLNELEQKIVRLHYLEDMSHEKIAEELEIIPVEVTKIRKLAIGKVAKTCNRAMDKLRKANRGVIGSDDENRRSGK